MLILTFENSVLEFHALLTPNHSSLDLLIISNKLYVLEKSVKDRVQVYDIVDHFKELDDDVMINLIAGLDVKEEYLDMIEQETDNLRKWSNWKPNGDASGSKKENLRFENEEMSKQRIKKRRGGTRHQNKQPKNTE